MEDRIVGPLTVIQFAILVIGEGFAFFLFSSTILSPLNKIFGLGFAILTLVVAMGKFNDQPMYRFFRFILAFLFTPKARVWRKTGDDIQVVKPPTQKTQEVATKRTKNISKADIARLAVVLDSRGTSGLSPQVHQPPPSAPPPAPR